MRAPFLFVLLPLVNACRAPEPEIATANDVIPKPVPSAPMRDWQEGAGKTKVSYSSDGVTLRGWTFLGPTAEAPRVLFFNGNAMTVDDSQPLYRDLAATGAAVTVFDYRGYGFSDGKADVLQFRRDALALYDHVLKELPARPLVVFGFSMGTAMATYVASERPVAGMILAAPIARADEEFVVYERALGADPAHIAAMRLADDAHVAFDELQLVAKSTAPLLVMHGDADDIVTFSQGQQIYAASPAKNKTFVTLSGGTHGDAPASPRSLEAIRHFLAGALAKQAE